MIVAEPTVKTDGSTTARAIARSDEAGSAMEKRTVPVPPRRDAKDCRRRHQTAGHAHDLLGARDLGVLRVTGTRHNRQRLRRRQRRHRVADAERRCRDRRQRRAVHAEDDACRVQGGARLGGQRNDRLLDDRAPAGLVIAKLPVRNVNVSGDVIGLSGRCDERIAGRIRDRLQSVRCTTTASNGQPAAGVKRAIRLPFRNVKVPATGEPPVNTRKDAGVTVAGSMGSVKVTDTGTVVPTPVALSGGSTLSTLGAVLSGEDVRNVDVNGAASALPAGVADSCCRR